MMKTKRKKNHRYLLNVSLFITIILTSILFVMSTYSKHTESLSFTKPNNNTIEIRSIDDQIFFPLGFYYSSFYDAKHRMKALREIAAVGFNTMFVFWKNLDDYETFLDEAQKLGIHIITELKRNDLTIVDQFKNKSAIFAWGIADDAGDHQSSNELLAWHKAVKATDPKHYTYISVSNWSKKWADYAHVADLIGGQSYPIGYPFNNRPKNIPNHLSEVNYVFNIANNEASKHNRPVIANLQTFKWKGQRWPTAKEVYNMTYQALLAGVKGIIFYTYDNPASRLRENPDLWNMVKSLAPEIKKLSPVLLKGNFTPLKTKFQDVLAGQWTYGDRNYVVVLNTSDSKTKLLSLSIPTKGKFRATPLFSDRPSGMIYKNGELYGEIKPEDVHIYQLLKI
ncbi:hypothetical protein [Chlorogloeopsis sp. ULAP02]|uniref:hypothetical protein n=1 Tax=Chlorogloeopsis sp. ULAP02 TaxID=3107926 RepID=UPI00313740FF